MIHDEPESEEALKAVSVPVGLWCFGAGFPTEERQVSEKGKEEKKEEKGKEKGSATSPKKEPASVEDRAVDINSLAASRINDATSSSWPYY